MQDPPRLDKDRSVHRLQRTKFHDGHVTRAALLKFHALETQCHRLA
jgi:hypothetical protein